MNGTEGEAVRAARLHKQGDGATYSHMMIDIARRSQRRLGYYITVAGFGVGGFQSR